MLEAGFDVAFSREEILSISHELIKDKLHDTQYLQGINDFTEILLSKFEK